MHLFSSKPKAALSKAVLSEEGSDVASANSELSACKTEIENLRQRLAIALGNCTLLESMVERRDQTVEGLRQQVEELEGRPTHVELVEELQDAKRQLEEKTATICVLKGQLGDSESMRLRLEHQLGEVARARNALHSILSQQMQSRSSSSSSLPLNSFSHIETQMYTIAQRMADFMQRSWQDSQARVNLNDVPKVNGQFNLQSIDLQDVCKSEPPDVIPAEDPKRTGAGLQGPEVAPVTDPTAHTADGLPIAVRSGRKRRKQGKGAANGVVSLADSEFYPVAEEPPPGCHPIVVEEVANQVTLHACAATTEGILAEGDHAGASENDAMRSSSIGPVSMMDGEILESTLPAKVVDLDEQWRDIADWLMEGPAMVSETSTASAAPQDPVTDVELTMRLYQEELRTAQEQLVDLHESLKRTTLEAERQGAQNASLNDTVAALLKRLEEALHQREELRHKLSAYEGFWGDTDPSQPSSPDRAGDTSSDSSDGEERTRPILAPRCEEPEPIRWRAPPR
eukprot:GGOE01018415.1.p1 GENE.GGOE01018415.1~~GGOE01018415.1.p1  ORF type:complete len:513 (-),score=81.79 GGOE01018415.1:228-1766(-)